MSGCYSRRSATSRWTSRVFSSKPIQRGDASSVHTSATTTTALSNYGYGPSFRTQSARDASDNRPTVIFSSAKTSSSEVRSPVRTLRKSASMRPSFSCSVTGATSTNFFKQTILRALILLTIWLVCFSSPVLCNRLRHHSRRYYDEHQDGFYGMHQPSESNAQLLPMFDLTQSDEVNVPWGGNAYLHCSVRNKSAKVKIAWTRLRDGILLTVDNQSFADPMKYFVSYVEHDNNYRLVIKNTNLDDSGVYQCELSTQFPQRRLVTLTVTANEGEIHGSSETNIGSVISLKCRVKVIQPNYQLPAALIWYHNDSGIRFVDTGGRARKKASTKDATQISEAIEIIDVRPEDAGAYRCAPTPDTLGGKQLAMWVDVNEGPAGNRLSARNTPQKQENFLDGRPSRSGAENTFGSISVLIVLLAVAYLVQKENTL